MSQPLPAAMYWRQCLELLPRHSEQYAAIYQRIGSLVAGYGADGPARAVPLDYQADHRPRDTWGQTLFKTVGSMAICAAVYWFLFLGMFQDSVLALLTSLGFVGLILVHELGHVWAMKRYGLSASPPIFIPFVGAVINLRQQPPNALVEAVVGIGGPALGAVGAFACFIAYLLMAPGEVREVFFFLTVLGAFLNLFNLLPLPPLDGGRITAAVSPWLWVFGLLALVGWVAMDYFHGRGVSIIKLLILFSAVPRVLSTLRRGRWRDTGYYAAVTRKSSVLMGAAYAGLGLALGALFFYTNYRVPVDPPAFSFF